MQAFDATEKDSTPSGLVLKVPSQMVSSLDDASSAICPYGRVACCGEFAWPLDNGVKKADEDGSFFSSVQPPPPPTYAQGIPQ